MIFMMLQRRKRNGGIILKIETKNTYAMTSQIIEREALYRRAGERHYIVPCECRVVQVRDLMESFKEGQGV